MEFWVQIGLGLAIGPKRNILSGGAAASIMIGGGVGRRWLPPRHSRTRPTSIGSVDFFILIFLLARFGGLFYINFFCSGLVDFFIFIFLLVRFGGLPQDTFSRGICRC